VIFENIISWFGCLRSLTSDQGTHFLNETIESLLKTFMVQYNKRNLYHPQANGVVEEFNKILEKGLTKVISANRGKSDERIPTTLWAYRTIVKKSISKLHFNLYMEGKRWYQQNLYYLAGSFQRQRE